MENCFHAGAIPSTVISDMISKYATDQTIGAYSLFLGQVRNDRHDDKQVSAIDFTSYEEMATVKTATMIDTLVEKYNLQSLHVLQSLGVIKTGEICLLVLSCAAHRKAAIDSCNEMVERFKSEIPVWGRELFEDDSYQWKVNTK
jgi:molybdopterin synthase catalytic subunit